MARPVRAACRSVAGGDDRPGLAALTDAADGRPQHEIGPSRSGSVTGSCYPYDSMMAVLFAVWALTLGLAWRGPRRAALVAGLIALTLSVAMFRYHTTDTINLDL